jgi:hypothetical protein
MAVDMMEDTSATKTNSLDTQNRARMLKDRRPKIIMF